MRAIVVEGSAILRQGLAALLGRWNPVVLSPRDDLVLALRSNAVAFVLLDELSLNQISVIQYVTPGVPVIVFAGRSTNKGRAAAFSAGATSYVDKMHLGRIEEVLEDIISRAGDRLYH